MNRTIGQKYAVFIFKLITVGDSKNKSYEEVGKAEGTFLNDSPLKETQSRVLFQISRRNPSPINNQYICCSPVLPVPQASAITWLTSFQCGQSNSLWGHCFLSSQGQVQGFLRIEGCFPTSSAIGWACRFDSGMMGAKYLFLPPWEQ